MNLTVTAGVISCEYDRTEIDRVIWCKYFCFTKQKDLRCLRLVFTRIDGDVLYKYRL